MSCDDRLARRAIIKELGIQKLTGSIGLLMNLVEIDVITKQEAQFAYENMIECGGFLPSLPRELG